jgi:hypothetical protein
VFLQIWDAPLYYCHCIYQQIVIQPKKSEFVDEEEFILRRHASCPPPHPQSYVSECDNDEERIFFVKNHPLRARQLPENRS